MLLIKEEEDKRYVIEVEQTRKRKKMEKSVIQECLYINRRAHT